ncbi:hypothetical protein ACFFX0_08265 [Citricoccus parietis]|uniref:Secreted protein n=1 Tax=Citricoccus parietis TaxID=592307 RepID=A0ABV5FY81_9MICC
MVLRSIIFPTPASSDSPVPLWGLGVLGSTVALRCRCAACGGRRLHRSPMLGVLSPGPGRGLVPRPCRVFEYVY